MKKLQCSEQLLVEELSRTGIETAKATKGLSAGELIGLIRTQLGMSQQDLSKRSGVPQPTISLLERAEREASITTLVKLAKALECDLLIFPLPKQSISDIRHKQARKTAQKKIQYLQGTMSLEAQEPDRELLEILVDQEVEELLKPNNKDLWRE